MTGDLCTCLCAGASRRRFAFRSRESPCVTDQFAVSGSCSGLISSPRTRSRAHKACNLRGPTRERTGNADAASDLAGRRVSLPSLDFAPCASVHCAFWKRLKSSAWMTWPSILCGFDARIRSIMPLNLDRLHAAIISNAALDPVNVHVIPTSSLPSLCSTKQICKRTGNRSARRQPIKHENFQSEIG